MGFSNWMIGIIRALRAPNNVTPPCSYFCAGGDADDIVVFVADIFVAGEGGVVDVLDGVVGVGCSHALELALVDAVDGEALEDGVGGCGAGCEAEG